MDKYASQRYQTQQVMSASPARLVAMLYDKAVSSLQEAIRAIEAGEIEARWRANARAIEIINHLWVTLNMDEGGEIAANLDQLYRFMLARLPEVDLHNNPGPAKDAINLLEPLRRSWHEIATQTNEKAPQAGAGKPSPQPAGGGDGAPDSEGANQPGVALSA